ncbi:MAG: hypothetical protein HRT56_01575 [Coraliomargarita sp.]|nr:hypothetical protein [Coraliomargarita sp.]
MSGSLLGGGGGGLGLKMPEIDFFGAKSKGEKICFVVHFGPATTTQKGESTPYTRMTAYTIRKRLEELVSGLPSQAKFNVTAFWAGHCNPFAERMLQATSAHKDLLRQWMAPVNPVESSTETYGSSFGKFGGLLAKTPWPQKIDKNIPSFGPAWYYNYVSPRSDEVKYFGEPVPKDATIHWARGVFWALVTQRPDTIYVLTTNYLPSEEGHPQQFTDAYKKICEDIYDVQGLKRPTVNVVVLTNAGANSRGALKTLERFGPLIKASKGKGSVIEDISDFMNKEERRRLESFAPKE